MSRVFLAEDEENLGAVLKNYLELSGFQVDWFSNGSEAYNGLKNEQYDIYLLDVMLPKIDGFSLSEEIRIQDKHVPVIFLTAKSQKVDVLKGYALGADDYITKPFDSEILVQKIKALLRRRKKLEPKTLLFEIGHYQYDAVSRELEFRDHVQRLSPKEGELLKLLCQNMNHILVRQEALLKIWNEDSYFTTRSMDVYITKLRKYLSNDNKVEIENIHSSGYRLKVSR